MQEPLDIKQLADSPDPACRLRSLRMMREAIAEGQDPTMFFDLARTLIGDDDNDCRWQAAIVVGESIESNPEGVWQVICEFGESHDEDMRDAIATLLLEHLLEHHFDAFFGRLRLKIEQGAPLLADTLCRCWAFGDAESRWHEVAALLKDVEGV